ncbi:MAG: YkgJ family cysteine cluster protein [Planctomycetota bacterium]
MELPVWYEKGLSFTCTQCGNCCTGPSGFVWISDEEVTRLAEHLGLSREVTVRKYCRTINGKLSLKERKVGFGKYDCIFLTGEPGGKRGCGIYEARPLQCRTWPFWPENIDSEKAWDRLSHKTCPGMNSGKRYTRRQIERIRDAADWPKNPPTSAG